MRNLVYSMMVSIDGFVAGPNGEIVGAVDEEVHRFANEEQRKSGTDFYGRRMYEAMVYWETADTRPESPEHEREFSRIWKDTEKVVVSTTLNDVASGRISIVRDVESDAIRHLKATSDKKISVSGPTLAARFINEGLVDEYGVYLTPVIVGGGTPFLKGVSRRLDLKLTEEHRFGNGVVFLRYRPRG